MKSTDSNSSCVVFDRVGKQYAGDVWAVQDLSWSLNKGQFLALLGPSGCGKTTSLRMLAGLEKNTHGRINIDGEVVSDASSGSFFPPEKRHLGMVFQSYAVWPHMNVFNNVAYPLKIANKSRDEIQVRVRKVLDVVEMSGLESRMPSELSGGQQQRVALARGLVAEPSVLLLDEPLSNLDAKLRAKMRQDIRQIQKTLNLTVVYVTHDQVEAQAMSDVVILMNRGKMEQMGSFKDLKENPKTEFVRQFFSESHP